MPRIELDRVARQKRAELAELNQRLSTLTPREREVLPLVVSGLLNKQAAAELGISETTIQIHRGQIMKKMQAESFAELVRMAATLEIPMTRSRQATERRKLDSAPGTARSGELEYRAAAASSALTHSRPWWASMIARQIDRPMPMPSDLVVNSGLKIRSLSCVLIPAPVSATDTMTPSPS